MSCLSRVVARSAMALARHRFRGRRLWNGLRVEPSIEGDGVVPEQLPLELVGHVPIHHRLDGLRKPALTMWVIGGVHQDSIAQKVDDGARHARSFGHLDTLEISAALDVFTGLVLELWKRLRDRLGMLIQAVNPERQPAVARLQHTEPQIR